MTTLVDAERFTDYVHAVERENFRPGDALDAFERATITRDLIDPADIIGPGEIRQLAGGVTRATMKHWREGRNTRGAGTFPAPFKTVSGVELYDRRAVLAWLEEHRPA
jgi:hypothetical protein